MKERLCVVDMNFTWPPDGGAPVELLPILSRYSELFDVVLLVPRLTALSSLLKQPWPLSRTKLFTRGQIDLGPNLPFRIQFLDFHLSDFHPPNVCEQILQFLSGWKPDRLIVADSWYFKPDIVLALARYHPVLFLFAHEMMCIKGNGMLYRKGRVCDVDYLSGKSRARRTCMRCATVFYLSYPSPRWVFEYLASKAWSRAYQDKCIRAFAAAAAVVVKNHSIERRLAPYVRGKMVVAPPAIDPVHFAPATPANRDQVFRFLVAGRLAMRTKGSRVALAAAQRLWRSRHDFELWLAGTRPRRGAPFLRRVPWYPYERVRELYQSVDVLLFPSLAPESFGLVALEAMACGVPVIGSRTGGIPEAVDEGRTGFLVPPGDSEALADRMAWCLDHPSELAEMKSHARERTVALFSMDLVFNRFYRTLFSGLPACLPS